MLSQFGAFQATDYYGFAAFISKEHANVWYWIICLIGTSIVFAVLYGLEKYNSTVTQITIVAITCGYGGVSGSSFLANFFGGFPISPFDPVSYIGVPIAFRWNDLMCIMHFLCWVGIVIYGIIWHLLREQMSPNLVRAFAEVEKSDE